MAGTALGFALAGESNTYLTLGEGDDALQDGSIESIDFTESGYAKFNVWILVALLDIVEKYNVVVEQWKNYLSLVK